MIYFCLLVTRDVLDEYLESVVSKIAFWFDVKEMTAFEMISTRKLTHLIVELNQDLNWIEVKKKICDHVLSKRMDNLHGWYSCDKIYLEDMDYDEWSCKTKFDGSGNCVCASIER